MVAPWNQSKGHHFKKQLMKTILFEGISFNVDALETKTKSEFIEEVKHHFPGTTGKKKIEELYKIIHGNNSGTTEEGGGL